MKKMPAWAKILAALIGFAMLFGFSQILLYLDRLPGGGVGLD